MSLRRHTYQSEDSAFEQLYGRYAQNVFRYALTVLGKQADAEDATQTTFLNAYRAYRRGERPLQPERWLISIAHNTCRERYRYAQRRPHEVSLGEAMSTVTEVDDTTSAEELKQALLCLPSSQRSALVMRELEGRSYDETAQALRISSAALGTLLFRARESLREHLAEPMSCNEARTAIAKQLDRKLSASETSALRAHLRSCNGCATLARSRRAQKRGPRQGVMALPGWIGRFLPTGAGASATGAGVVGIAVKAAAVVALGTVAAGGLYAGGGGRPGPLAPRSPSAAAAVLPASSAHAQNNAPRAVPVALRIHLVGAGTPPVVDMSSSSGVVDAAPPIASGPASPEPASPSSAPQDGTTPASTGDGADAAPVAPPATTADASPSVTTETPAVSTDATVPPGQAKKVDTATTAAATDATPSGNVPPGQAKKSDTTTTTAAAAADATPSGNVPPGQAKKSDTTTTTAAAADATPSGKVPPGQAKKGTAP